MEILFATLTNGLAGRCGLHSGIDCEIGGQSAMDPETYSWPAEKRAQQPIQPMHRNWYLKTKTANSLVRFRATNLKRGFPLFDFICKINSYQIGTNDL